MAASKSSRELLDNAWGYGFEGYEHTITTHINRLCIKIEPDFNRPVYILTTGCNSKLRGWVCQVG